MDRSEGDFAGRRFVSKKVPAAQLKRDISVHVSSGDIALIRAIQEKLGVGQSEAVRTAVRVYASLLLPRR